MVIERQSEDLVPIDQIEERLAEEEVYNSPKLKNAFVTAQKGSGWKLGGPVGDQSVFAYRRDSNQLMALRTVFLGIANCVALGLYMLAFSSEGYGLSVFDSLSRHYNISVTIVSTCVVLSLILYVFDFSLWPEKARILKNVLISVLVAGFSVAAVLAASKYPQLPVAVFLLLTPGYVFVVKKCLFYNVTIPNFLMSMHYSLSLCCFGLITYWVWWFSRDGNFWDQKTKETYSSQIHSCTLPSYNSSMTARQKSEVSALHDWCETGFLIWISPMIIAMGCFVFSMLCRFVANTMFNFGGQGIHLSVFLAMVFFCVLAMWVGASVAGGGMNITNLVNNFAFVGLILTCIILVSSLGLKSLKEKLRNGGKVATNWTSNGWFRAIIVLTSAPLFLLYCMLSFVNQLVRVNILQNCIAKDMSPEEKKMWFTARCTNQIESFKKWPWTSVAIKAIYVGIFFMFIQVGMGKATYLFLSWLTETLKPLSLPAVTGIFYAVGLFMFLLPPIPGPPVYLAGGVILTASAWKNGEGSMSFPVAIAYTCFICFTIKLVAIVCQQKGFGEQFADNKTVKTFVGVNSIQIRAVKHILQQPGITIPKVFVLVGGPDWPVSVLTGILKLNVVQMLIGSLPVIFLVVPTVTAGAFMLKINPDDPTDIWPSVFGVTLMLSGMAQSFAFAGFGYNIQKVAKDHKEELMLKPLDQEVLAVEKRNEEKTKAYDRVTAWPELPVFIKVVLLLSLLAMLSSCYIFNMVPKRCFAEFTVTQPISSLAPEGKGKWYDMILHPWGSITLALLLISTVLFFVFTRWAKCKMKEETQDFEI